MTSFGERLRELRTAQHMTQRDVAHQADIDVTTLSHIECGRMEPSSYLIYRLANVLEASAGELFCLSGKVPHGLRAMLHENPLLTELVYVLSERVLPDEVYKEMIELAREGVA